MRDGTSSRTAELVCAGRAIAHADGRVPGYADPTARVLASDEAREWIARFEPGRAPRGLRDRAFRRYLGTLSRIMVARTLAIDEGVREAASPQLVILGAGLDGRAWRMKELADVTVLEVDHPDTQRTKRARIGALEQAAKEVRFVAVDFTKDSLDEALERAGHDASRTTTWIWEGVIMYLTPEQVDATLRVIAKRSASGSRLLANYHPPSVMVRVMNLFVRSVGEPFRSRFRPEAMRALLDRHGFDVTRDESIRDVGARIGGVLARDVRPVVHLRLVTGLRR